MAHIAPGSGDRHPSGPSAVSGASRRAHRGQSAGGGSSSFAVTAKPLGAEEIRSSRSSSDARISRWVRFHRGPYRFSPLRDMDSTTTSPSSCQVYSMRTPRWSGPRGQSWLNRSPSALDGHVGGPPAFRQRMRTTRSSHWTATEIDPVAEDRAPYLTAFVAISWTISARLVAVCGPIDASLPVMLTRSATASW